MATVTGSGGNDTITTGSSSDQIDSLGGADVINSGDGNDTIFSGSGNDTVLAGNGDDQVFGGDGADSIDAGSGNNTVDGGLGNDTITATTGSDQLFGGNGNDSITAGAGNDTVEGGVGNDWLSSGDGADQVKGGTGADTIRGGSGNDTLEGDEDADTFIVTTGFGAARIIGGQGATGNGVDRDTLDLTGVKAPITVTFTGPSSGTVSDGTNTLSFETIEHLRVSTGPVTIRNGSSFAGTIETVPTVVDGTSGNDLMNPGYADAQGDQIDGNDGTAEVIHAYGGDDSVSAGDGSDTIFGGTGNDFLSAGGGQDLVYGGDGNDVLQVGLGADTLYGDAGDDWIDGGGGDDALFGGLGQDTLAGGDGNDLLVAEEGDDWLVAGAGNDTSYGGDGNDAWSRGDLGDDLGYGGAGNDTLSGDAGNDTLYGGTDDDVVEGHDGSDQLYGGDGNDYVVGFDVLDISMADNRTLDPKLGSDDGAADLLDGGAGKDTLLGGGGDDTILGGIGKDSLFGGKGDDMLRGDADGRDPSSMASSPASGKEHGFVLINETAAPIDLYWVNSGGKLEFQATIPAGEAGPVLTSHATGDNWAIVDPASGEVLTYLESPAGKVVFNPDMTDVLDGGSGNDTLYGGLDDDTLQGGAGDDSLSGGAGNDLARFTGPVQDYGFDYGPGGTLIVTDSVQGRDGQDTLDGVEFVEFDGATYRLIQGDDGGNTTLQGPDDGTPSLIIAHDGNDWGGGHATSDAAFGGAGDDTLDGGAGDDTLSGDDGADLLRGDGGNDALFGGAGADTLQGGADDDALSGGAGNDLFDFDRGSGADMVTDFDMTREDGRTADQLDVSDLRNASGDAITWRDVVVTDTNGDGTGDAVLVFPEGERVVLQGVRPDEVDSKQEMAAIGIPCFVRGTPILTPGGWRPVEALFPGDLVQTTRGLRPVIWSGARRITPAELAARPGLMPIRFATGAIGNTRPLRLSPQHAVAMTGPDGQTVLVRARHLAEAGLAGVRVAGGHRAVSYHHVLLDGHAVVFAAGAAVESLYPGRQALAALAMPARLRIAAAIRRRRGAMEGFPALADLALVYGDRVHPLIGRRAALALCARRGRAGAVIAPTLPDRCG